MNDNSRSDYTHVYHDSSPNGHATQQPADAGESSPHTRPHLFALCLDTDDDEDASSGADPSGAPLHAIGYGIELADEAVAFLRYAGSERDYCHSESAERVLQLFGRVLPLKLVYL